MQIDQVAITRRLWAAVLMSNSLWVGFVAGAAAGGWLFAPDDAGGEGGAQVLWYGLGGALLTALGAAIALRVLDAHHIRSVALGALVVAAALATYIAYAAGG